MRLTKIAITNHSRLVDVELQVRSHLVLVGPNDAGKSSLLRCLDLLLGASTAQLYQRIDSEDFRDTEQPLVIEAELASLSSSDEAMFPDEITVNPVSGAKHLAVRLSAALDSAADPVDRADSPWQWNGAAALARTSRGTRLEPPGRARCIT